MKHIKKICMLLIMFTLSLSLSACSELTQDFHNYKRLESIDDIKNKRIGVVATTSADFCLTENRDVKLLRYDDLSGAMFALKAKQIDALATFNMIVPNLFDKYNGIEVVPGSLYKDSGIAMFGSDEEELRDEFNEFLDRYHKTDEYREYQEKIDNLLTNKYDPIIYDKEKYNGNRVITIASSGTSEPVHYIDKDSNLIGIDFDLFYKFCDEKHYDVEYFVAPSDPCVLSLRAGKVDVCFMGFTLFEYEEYLKTGLFPCNATYDYDIVLVQAKEGESITLKDAIPK